MKRSLPFILLFALASCGIGGSKGSLNFSTNIQESVRGEDVDFSVLRKEVLPKCIGCHQSWTTPQALSDYIVAGDPDGSLFYDSVKTGWMPKNSPPLSGANLEIVRNYILNLKVPTPEPAPEPDPQRPVVSYQELHEKVFQVSCLPCHARILNDEAALNERWIDRESLEESPLLVQTVSGRMPKNRPALTTEQLELIRNYVNQFRD